MDNPETGLTITYIQRDHCNFDLVSFKLSKLITVVLSL